MNKAKNKVIIVLSMLGTGISLVLLFCLYSSFQVKTFGQKPSNLDKKTYEVQYSELATIRKKVENKEEALIQWVSTYAHNGRAEGQNTLSPDKVNTSSSSKYIGLDALISKYSTLSGIVSDARVSYFYNAELQELTQQLTVERNILGDEKTAFIVYNSNGELVSYTVSDSLKG